MQLPQLTGKPVITDGGIETDLIYHHGVDLPEFASFPLLDDGDGRELLRNYFAGYIAIAQRANVALQLDTPTWRANPDWGAKVGYDLEALRRVNRDSVSFLAAMRQESGLERFLISGCVGPQGDGYVVGEIVDPDLSAKYHAPQIEAFAEAGADVVTALTMTNTNEAIGVVRAARAANVPVAISFTVEQDGRLPDGSALHEAIDVVDRAASPDYFMVNCAHPTHIAQGLASAGAWRERIVGLRANASSLSHEELDAATELDEGDPQELAASTDALRASLPNLRLVGGCCGTDARHIAALWGVA